MESGAVLIDEENCTECFCNKGKIKCKPLGCPVRNCAKPVREPGNGCCPVCKNQCHYMGQLYDHGHVFWPKPGARCECRDGSMQCAFHQPENCPQALNCPQLQQEIPPNELCPKCANLDFCATEEPKCHQNSTCKNEKFRRVCQCQDGFLGDGLECFDVDECKMGPPFDACGPGTRCLNTIGGYTCECRLGFVRIDEHNCLDVLLY